MKLRLLFSYCLALIFLSCGKDLPSFDGIDLEEWKADKYGCNQMRSRSINKLEAQKDKFKSLSEMEVIHLLGRPDQNELYKRNQKFYYYFLEAGIRCKKDSIEIKKLVIRFNAIGLAKEVSVE